MELKRALVLLLLLLFIDVDARLMQFDKFDIFCTQKVHRISILSEDSTLLEELSSRHRRKNEQCLQVAIMIDGVAYPKVGIREKGVHSNDFAWTAKKPLKVVLDEFEEVSHQNIERFNLANSFEDPSFLRDVLSLYCLRRLKLPAPRASHARVYINEEYHGLYAVIEQVNKNFLQRNFGESSGNLFKAVGGCLDTDAEIKGKFFELKTNKSTKDRSRLRAFVKLLEGGDRAFFTDSIEHYLNVEGFLRCMAFDFIAANTDSYIWGRCHNFYLYEKENGQFEWIPWDYNLSFGYDLRAQAESSLPPNQLTNERPLLSMLLADKKYQSDFNRYCTEVLDLLNSKEIRGFVVDQHKFISSSVKADTNAFYSYEVFKKSVKGKSLHSGLNADIPSLLNHIKSQKKRYGKELKH